MNDPFTLSSCIRIEERRISRQVMLPCQVYFDLSPEIISHLEIIKQQNLDLFFASDDLINLRFYALINSGLITQLGNVLLPSLGITFTTNYIPNSQALPLKAIRSQINLSGKISQEIQQDFAQQPELLWEVSQIHYWLIEQIWKQLPMSPQIYVSWLIWGCWLIICTGLMVILCSWLPLYFWLKIAIALVSSCLLKLSFDYIFKIKLTNWLIRFLSHYCFPNRIYQKQLLIALINHGGLPNSLH